LAVRVPFPAVQDFSVLHSVQTDSGAHAASYKMGLGALSLGCKAAGHETDHSPPSSAEDKKGRAIPAFPHRSSWDNA
jgi:hypothetical protein